MELRQSDLVLSMRKLEKNHEPNDFPHIQMKFLTDLCDELDYYRAKHNNVEQALLELSDNHSKLRRSLKELKDLMRDGCKINNCPCSGCSTLVIKLTSLIEDNEIN